MAEEWCAVGVWCGCWIVGASVAEEE